MQYNQDNIIYKKAEGIEYIQFKKLLDLGINHCYTLKCENFDFTESSPYCNESYEKICRALNIKRENILVTKQAHTDNVKCVNSRTTKDELIDTDGLITDEKGVVLGTKNADCILFMCYDPVKKVIANVHSGWKGTFQKIIQKAIVKMINNYGCKAEDILCFISPSIRRCHFEVDEDIKELCESIFEFTKRTDEFIIKGDVVEEKQKYFIDTVLINQILLQDLGVKPENIIDSGICSVCNKDKINSFRVQGKDYMRSIALIEL